MKRLVLLSILLVGCAEDKECISPVKVPASELCILPQDDDSRPDILIIGDSISMGYTPAIIAQLGAQYDIIHNPCNARHSGNGASRIDNWLALRDNWAAITFNHGAHDVYVGAGVSPKCYESNMSLIAQKIKEATPRPFFVNTTHVPENDPLRHIGLEVTYNSIAAGVMLSYDIPVIDLYSISLGMIELHVNPVLQNDVHWQEAGSQILGAEIVNFLN